VDGSGQPEQNTRVVQLPDHGQALKLLVVAHSGVTEFDLGRDGDYTVGRSPSAEVCLDAASVSRAHALLVVREGRVSIQDLRSTNGTFLNGSKIGEEPEPIGPGDALRFGDLLAQLRGSALPTERQARLLGGDEFADRMAEEAERAVRFGSSFALLALEAIDGPRDADLRRIAMPALRAVDVLTVRTPERIDVLLVEARRDDARRVGERLAAQGERHGVQLKMGIACFPEESPSADAALFSAQLALGNKSDDSIVFAREAARSIRLAGRDALVADPAMVRLYAFIERIAAAPLPVLVVGETGAGKELAVEAVHLFSKRRGQLVKINCAALPETLLESELFGYEKGAFSGADSPKPGLVRTAEGGTLFLDEIGDMPLALQGKLLRVVEDMRVRPIGSAVEHAVDVRVVAATNRDLRTEAASGRFRLDLYYRLSGALIQVPPLRERGREIPLLAEKFARETAEGLGVPSPSLDPRTTELLRGYGWPGNVRELRHAVASAVVASGSSVLLPEHFALSGAAVVPAAIEPRPSEGPHTEPILRTLDEEVRHLERRRIVEALEAEGGNQTRAAERLGMPRRTLVAKLKNLGIRRG